VLRLIQISKFEAKTAFISDNTVAIELISELPSAEIRAASALTLALCCAPDFEHQAQQKQQQQQRQQHQTSSLFHVFAEIKMSCTTD
jgi:5-deoxy-D-glucuronate isomerase